MNWTKTFLALFVLSTLVFLPLVSANSSTRSINGTTYFDFNSLEVGTFPELTPNWFADLDANSIVSDTNNALSGARSFRIDTNRARNLNTMVVDTNFSRVRYGPSGVWNIKDFVETGTFQMRFCISKVTDLNNADNNALTVRFVQSGTKFSDLTWGLSSLANGCITVTKAMSTATGTVDDWQNITDLNIFWKQKVGLNADFNVYIDSIGITKKATPPNTGLSILLMSFVVAILGFGIFKDGMVGAFKENPGAFIGGFVLFVVIANFAVELIVQVFT